MGGSVASTVASTTPSTASGSYPPAGSSSTQMPIATSTTSGSGSTTNSGSASSSASSTSLASSSSVSGGAVPFRPKFILGADVGWTLEDEAGGAKYFEGTTQKSLEQILVDNGFNYMRIRTFVNPCASGGYATSPILFSTTSESPLPNQCWCDAAHSITLAKRAKACGMGVLLDFHMSDTWASIGVQTVPSAWSGMGAAQMQQAAHDYVKGVLAQMITAGVEPDMVQIGNEINSHVAGVSISDWASFSGLVNAGAKAVRETDPKIVIVEQNGRPRDAAFISWVDEFVRGTPPIDFDVVGGSTYGTTNGGTDWQTEFGTVITTYAKPVMSVEYTGDKTSLINGIMHGFANGMGWGTFIWEPTRYGTPLFDLSGQNFTTNSHMAAYPPLARGYGLPVPSGVCK